MEQPPSQGVPQATGAALWVRLVVRGGPHAGTETACSRVVTLVGSREGCKVALRHPQVAPVQAALVNDGFQVLAIDLVTPRGTLLNGLKLEHERLSNGDVLTVGPWSFTVRVEERAHSGDADVHPFDLEPTPRSIVLEHVDTGRVMQPNRELCIIGRRNGCDIVISDKKVSRVHALLLNYFGRPAIFDLLSNSGTKVNDANVDLHLLANGDVITIGEARFKVRLVGSPVGNAGAMDEVGVETTIALTAEEKSSDLIDIHTTESAQPWRIADKLEKLSEKR